MFQHLKRLGTETAVYGVSTILGRFLNFLLVPFYTNILAPGEYGIVAYAYSVIAFITVIYSYGMESAFFKYSSTLDVGTPRQNFSTPFLSLLGSSILLSLAVTAFASPLAGWSNIPSHLGSIVQYAAWILAFDAMAIIPFAALRMEHKPKQFAAIKFLNILLNVALNITFLVILHVGVIGVFISGLIASIVTLLVLLPTIARHLTLEFNTTLWRALLKFGLPYVPAGLSNMVVQVIDRPILRSLTDDATVGVYQANYRLGVFMMLVVSMYDYAWRPFYFSVVKEANAKEIFARVLTYLVLFMSAVFLVLMFFIGDIIRINVFGHHIIGQNYWGGLSIVPIVLLGYMFLGISTNLSAGIYIEKKTRYLAPISFLGAIINVVANYLLIPSIGMLGAAWATFFSYFIMAVTTYFVVQRIYPVSYEFGRIAKIAGAVGIVMILYFVVDAGSGLIGLLWKTGLLALFLLSVYLMKFFESREMSAINRLLGGNKIAGPPMNEPEHPIDDH